MKTLLTTLLAFGVLAFGTTANALTITPDTIDGFLCDAAGGPDGDYCWNGGVDAAANDAFNAGEITTETGYGGILPLELLYKANYEDVTTEDGTYADNYDTTWADSEPTGGTIFSVGVDVAELDALRIAATAPGATQAEVDAYNALNAQVIDCGACYLYVKDGNNDPNWYIFEISRWNGTDSIELSGFWPEGVNGSISHVAIFGAEPTDKGLIPPVPIPAAAWLFGSGLIGLVGIGRRKA